MPECDLGQGLFSLFVTSYRVRNDRPVGVATQIVWKWTLEKSLLTSSHTDVLGNGQAILCLGAETMHCVRDLNGEGAPSRCQLRSSPTYELLGVEPRAAAGIAQ